MVDQKKNKKPNLFDDISSLRMNYYLYKLKNNKYNNRMKAVSSCAKINKEKCIEELRNIAKEADIEEKRFAIAAIASISKERCFAELKNMAKDANFENKKFAVTALTSEFPSYALKEILNILTDLHLKNDLRNYDPDLRADHRYKEFLSSLGEFKTFALNILTKQFINDLPDILWGSLSNIKCPGYLPDIELLLIDRMKNSFYHEEPDAHYLSLVIVLLGRIKNDQVAERLIRTIPYVLDTLNSNVIPEALKEQGLPQFKQILFGNITDFWRLGETRNSIIIEEFSKILKHTEDVYLLPLPRLRAAIGMAGAGDKNAAYYLQTMFAAGTRDIRLTAAAFLSMIGQPEWKKWVLGDDKDLIRIGEGKHPAAMVPLKIAILEGKLYSISQEEINKFKLPYIAMDKLGDQNGYRFAIDHLFDLFTNEGRKYGASNYTDCCIDLLLDYYSNDYAILALENMQKIINDRINNMPEEHRKSFDPKMKKISDRLQTLKKTL